MAPKVLPLPKDDTIQAVQDFVNKAVPSVNIDMESPALPPQSPQSRLAVQQEGSSTDPGPSTRGPHSSLSLTAFPELIQHFKDSILPTLHYATRLLTSSETPATEPSKPPRLRRHSTTQSDRSLGKSSSAQSKDQNYEWRQGETTDGYCLFDLSASGKGATASESQPLVVLMVLSPWKYSGRDLEDLVSERQTRKSSSPSSSKRSKIAALLTKLATHSQQVQSRHVIVSTYESWSFGRFELNPSGSTEYGTVRLTSAMSHDSGESGMINSQARSSQPDHWWPVTVLQASLYWIRQTLESSKPTPLSPRKARIAASPRKRVRDEADGDTEDEAEVYDTLQASYSSFSSVDQSSPPKRSKPSRLSWADLPSIQEEDATSSSLRRSSRRRSVVQSSMGSSSSATAVAEKTIPKPTATRRKPKKSAASTRTESSKRDTSARTRTTAKSKPTTTEKPVPPSRPSTSSQESKPLPRLANVSAPSPRRSRKHAREDDLTDIDDQPSPSKKARIRPSPLALAAPKSPTRRPRNEATAVASPIYVSSSPATTTRVTRSSSLVKSSSRTLYLERIYVPGTGIAIAESDRWSNQGNLSDRDREWLNSKDDSYQTVVESDDREEEFYGDVPSPAAMAKLRSGSEEYDSGYGRSTSPYVPDEGALKHLAGRTDHLNDPKSMGSLLNKGSKTKKTSGS
ncbi:hypothetical protein M407DRAFT_18479 [Tulasnella calospora MUT 4182]|uniref:Uncharacterized protein n=1 Tax=Tulasnella calospora MUT 4182 TaxID=1051891 RepID=A0A0C3QTW8_9AGAM|nr:hypothetical protein M407DRAFT_18479 [Tulasnella calospora MUT 4182]